METVPEKLSNIEAAVDNMPVSPWHLPCPWLQPNLYLPIPVILSVVLSSHLSFLSL